MNDFVYWRIDLHFFKRHSSLFVYFNNIIEGNATDWTTLASLSTAYTSKVMTTRNKCCIALSSIAYFTGFCRVHLALLLWLSSTHFCSLVLNVCFSLTMYLSNGYYVWALHVTGKIRRTDGTSSLLWDSLVSSHLTSHALSTYGYSSISLGVCATLILGQGILLISSVIRRWRVRLLNGYGWIRCARWAL